ncbi:MAG: peptide-methionine (S)-S-oxide reductase MsrA [Acidobacteria bacterium]|nr:peptide-methionine (S)-S-oxide reductase MsrA [Acidobacteriota bacterium]
MFSKPFKSKLPSAREALPGRSDRMSVPTRHHVTGGPLEPQDTGLQQATFGMGCFWGAEKMFWETAGVVSSQVGYAGGVTPNPTYEEVCSGGTGHTEVVRVFFNPAKIRYEDLLRVFWEGHDPTQGMRQHGDVGTQYRSAIYYYDDDQRQTADASRAAYQQRLRTAGFGDITTEIAPAPTFYYAEAYHQQYLQKNPNGYCGHGGTGVACPVGLGNAAAS